MNSRKTRTWIVLGANSVVGRAFARKAAAAGNDIILLGREKDDLLLVQADLIARYPNVSVDFEELDVSNLDSFSKTVEACEAKAKNIISVFSALETAYTQKECGRDLGKIKNMFQINYLVQIYFLTAVSQPMQKQGCGEIVVLGSTAGEYGMADNYAYGSTKAALHVWLQGFQTQMAENLVSVCIVKTDDWDTVGERKNVPYQRPLDIEGCAAACFHFADKRFKIRYYPWYSAVTVRFRRLMPYLNKNTAKS